MSYASNTWMFSQGQVDAMLSTLNQPDWQGGRLNLKNSNVFLTKLKILPARLD